MPYWLQGALFAPTFLLLLFFLKISCLGESECFADVFSTPAFLPLSAVYRAFGPVGSITNHEPIFLLVYWMIVGLLLGLLFDIYRSGAKK
jgi:hypothetical protein